MFKMGIGNFNIFLKKVKRVMECLDEFCTSLENSNLQNMATGGENSEIKKIVEQIQNTHVGAILVKKPPKKK